LANVVTSAFLFEIFLWAGVDVMNTIFGDFRQFSAKNWRFPQKTNVMIKKRQFLRRFFWRKYF
jgi:hypothetical protein